MKLPVPDVPSYPKEIKLEFLEEGRDKFNDKLKEVLGRRGWEQFKKVKEEVKVFSSNFRGIEGIKTQINAESLKRENLINTSFTGLESLRDSAKKLVIFKEIIKGRNFKNN